MEAKKTRLSSFYSIKKIRITRVLVLGGGLGGKKESGQLRFGGKDRPFRKPMYGCHESMIIIVCIILQSSREIQPTKGKTR